MYLYNKQNVISILILVPNQVIMTEATTTLNVVQIPMEKSLKASHFTDQYREYDACNTECIEYAHVYCFEFSASNPI